MMIVQPDFLDHWKTQMLLNLTGDKASPLLVLRLWAYCQVQRQEAFPKMTPETLKAVCRWEGEADQLQNALAESGFIEVSGPGVTVHEWEKVNAKLLQCWENGRKGGRPPKTRQQPKRNPSETDRSREDAIRPEFESPPHEGCGGAALVTPTSAAVNDHADAVGVSAAEAAKFFDYYEQRGWTDRNGRPVCNWHAALRRWKATAADHAGGTRQPGGRDREPIRADYENPNDPLLGGQAQTP